MTSASTPTKRTIGIINSGGDCAGINTVIAAVVTAGTQLGYQFYGFELGWEGLLDRKYRVLTLEDAAAIAHLGGTILHTTNRGRFAAKRGMGETVGIDPEVLAECKESMEELGVEGLIVIGGDGTLSGALQLGQTGVNIVGIPKSIDNDLSATDRTFGFSTAVQVAVDAVDKIKTTAFSHNRIFFIESMGRNAGWLALYTGVASAADAILLPEFPAKPESIVDFLRDRRDHHRQSTILVVSESFQIDGEVVTRGNEYTNEVIFAGVTDKLIRRIETLAPNEFEMRNVVLGHTQRGGSPIADDRILSTRFGTRAIEAYDQGMFGHMVSLQDDQIVTVDLEDAVNQLKLVTKDDKIYQAAVQMGIFFGEPAQLEEHVKTHLPHG